MTYWTKETFRESLNKDVPDIRNKNIWIWGTGNTAQLYQEGFVRLAEEGFCIKGYCDNDSAKWGRDFFGKPVISPEKLQQLDNVCVLVCSPQRKVIEQVGRQLEEYHMEWHTVDEVILKSHRFQVLECYDLLNDEESKDTYANVVTGRMRGEFVPFPGINADNQYFALNEFLLSSSKEVFIDCGAYVGDTVEQYIWKRNGVFEKIIAFEPDRKNFKAMCRRLDRIKEEWNIGEDAILPCPCGVGQQGGRQGFQSYDTNRGLGSKFVISDENCSEGCMIVALDEYVTEPYSFLKADIESYEYKMLLGAEKGIKKNRPLLAVCIYHNAVDLYSIPLLVKRMVPQYKIAVRQHSVLPEETVLYAWTEK